MTTAQVHLAIASLEQATVVTVTGDLNLVSYPSLRDGLLKIATDAPDGLVADISGLVIDDSSLVSVFSLVAMRIGDWPGIPFTIVAAAPVHQVLLGRHVVDRYVPVRADLAAATAALDRPVRRRAERTFARFDGASARARDFVTGKLAEWEVPELSEDARYIATELVENVLKHTTSEPRLRLGPASWGVHGGRGRPGRAPGHAARTAVPVRARPGAEAGRADRPGVGLQPVVGGREGRLGRSRPPSRHGRSPFRRVACRTSCRSTPTSSSRCSTPS